MSQIPPQTWQREPYRQTIAPVSTRVLHSIWPVIQRIREIFMVRVKSLAKPVVFPKGFRSNVKAAIIGGVIVMLYSMLIKAGTITDIPEMLKTQRVQASVVTEQSGYARSVDQSLMPLNKTLQTIGDDDQDQQVKLFLTYYFGSIPDSAKVSNARLTFQCTLEGDISGFGDLSLHMVAFDGYSESVFNSFPQGTMNNNMHARLYFVDNTILLSGCKSGQTVAFAHEGLAQMVESHRRDGKINLVLYFEQNSILSNHKADGIKIVTTPQLHVSFIP
jgi:hypothetical protein